jgi:DNA-binding MarR family transcriptional regulator
MPAPMPPTANRLGAPQKIDDLLLYRMNHVVGVAGKVVTRACEGQFGISRREWRFLGLLSLKESMLSSELATRSQLDRARTSRYVTSLVAKKLVSRQVQQGDHRQFALRLTPAGQAVVQRLLPLVQNFNTTLLSVLTPDEVAVLDDLLNRLQSSASQLVEQFSDLPRTQRRLGRTGSKAGVSASR